MIAAINERKYLEEREHRRLVAWQTRELALMIASSIPYNGDTTSPAIKYAESISLYTEDEKKAIEANRRPEEENLQVGGFERFTQFMSNSEHGESEGQLIRIEDGEGPQPSGPLI